MLHSLLNMETYQNNVRDFCYCLKYLLTNDNEEKSSAAAANLEAALFNRVTRLIEHNANYPSVYDHVKSWAPFLQDVEFCKSSKTWSFILWDSVLLLGIKRNLDIVKREKGGVNSELNVSIGDQKIILKGILFLVRLGVYPNLIDGVRVSIAKKTEFNLDVSYEKLTPHNAHGRLIYSLIVILNLVKEKTLKAAIVTNHLLDLIAGLGQICYAPIRRIKPEDGNSESDYREQRKNVLHDALTNLNEKNFKALLDVYEESNKGSDFELVQEMLSDRRELESIFEKLQQTVYQPLLVRDLLLLQKYSATSKLKWFQRMCGHLLSSVVLRPNGLIATIDGILNNISDQDSGVNSNYTKYEMVAKLITQSPNQCSSVEKYFSEICPQLLQLLRSEEYGPDNPITKICCSVLNEMSNQHFEFCYNYLIEPIVKPLLLALGEGLEKSESQSDIVITETELSQCVIVLSKLFRSTLELNEVLLREMLRKFYHFFFELYAVAHGGTSHLRIPVRKLLLSLLDSSENCVELLNCAAFSKFDNVVNVSQFREDLRFCYGEEGGMCVKKHDARSIEDVVVNELEEKVAALCDIVTDLKDKTVLQEWFLVLLERLSEVLEVPDSTTQKDVVSDLTLLILIQNLAESEGPNLTKNVKRVVAFVRTTLSRSVQLLSKHNEADSERRLADESTFLAVSILMVLTSQKDQITTEDWDVLKSCSDPLCKLETMRQGTLIGNLAKEIRTAIQNQAPTETANYSPEESTNLSSFALAWQGLQNPLIPTKGNALIELKRLILEKDEEALEKKETLFAIFEEHLDHEDSYIYLTAIRALSVLAVVYTDEILPKMASRFGNLTQESDSLEFRLKLGEAIVQVSKNLGDMAPKYRNILLNSFLSTCKHEDAHLRASSLSNLGEICKLLKFSLGSHIQEILACLSSLSLSDPSVEVRRSSIMVLTFILKGLGKDSFMALESELLPIYRHLKKIYTIENDPIVKLHVEQALEEIALSVKELLTPSHSLAKDIRVLNLH